MTSRKREREAPEVGAMAGRVLRALVRRAEAGDTEALEQLLKLEQLLAGAIKDAGRGLHRFGYSYTELADVAGISRQAARERFYTGPVQLDELPPCTQCGQPFSARACGPTHAVIAADPSQHRIWADDAPGQAVDDTRRRADD